MLHRAMSLRRQQPIRGETLSATDRQTQAERRETAERAILEAAKAIVADRGLEELTLNEAGEAAGYSRALPAHYFGTKNAMVHALADHIVATYSERVRSGPLSEPGLQRLIDVINFCVDDAVRDPVTVRVYQALLGAGLTRTDLQPLGAKITHQAVEDIASVIRDARELGEVRPDVRARTEASLIVAALRGVLFQWLINPDHVSLSRMRDSLVTNVRNSLKA
jgi:AcrR family transcriptional regulator